MSVNTVSAFCNNFAVFLTILFFLNKFVCSSQILFFLFIKIISQMIRKYVSLSFKKYFNLFFFFLRYS